MKTRNLAVYLVLSAVMVTALTLAACSSSVPSAPAVSSPLNTPTISGSQYAYKSNMLALSPQQVAQAAQSRATVHLYPPTTSTQVVYAQAITPEQMPNMGLPCRSYATIETPPLVLVVLKGDFNTSGLKGHRGSPERVQYLAYLYDIWAGVPTMTFTSSGGGTFRKLLNDPTIAEDYPNQFAEQDQQLPCPTKAPGYTHYGNLVDPLPDAASVLATPNP